MLISLTLVRYRKRAVFFALLAMAIHRLPLWLDRRCSFWKLLGSGRNGTFDKTPDWQQWGLLATWETRADFIDFHEKSFISRWWRTFGAERYTMLCEPLESHGKWSGKQPFPSPGFAGYTGPVAILTRAQIRFSRLKNFWSHVDAVAARMRTAPGFVYSAGVGEAPLYLQATFSVWKSLDDVKQFAYREREHADVVRKTREENWYSEELFARFKPIEVFGTIKGENPLQSIV
ncbi:MAG: DUF3291 domain-containing protein [Mucilaginibacter polytrichastri]|nr:DUF3291 domain-containing protein [Mucilaginibacter polytrichastri]